VYKHRIPGFRDVNIRYIKIKIMHKRTGMAEWYERNKESKKEYQKEYYKNNKEKCVAAKKRCYEKLPKKEPKIPLTKEERSSRRKLRLRERMKVDPLYKLHQKIKRTIAQSIRRNGYTKKSSTYQILGCSYEEFKIWIENKFTEGMDWSNYGKWHFDHIIPIDSATNEDEIIKLNHYSNFQPLWASDNIWKSNKIL